MTDVTRSLADKQSADDAKFPPAASVADLFQPVRLGSIDLANRIVMAPMTRSRAGPGDIATPLMADYYAQRAAAGLIVTEGTQPSAAGKGYCRTPGIASPAQQEGWRATVKSVMPKAGASHSN
jgi:N-ethylmaleimide reductase